LLELVIHFVKSARDGLGGFIILVGMVGKVVVVTTLDVSAAGVERKLVKVRAELAFLVAELHELGIGLNNGG